MYKYIFLNCLKSILIRKIMYFDEKNKYANKIFLHLKNSDVTNGVIKQMEL